MAAKLTAKQKRFVAEYLVDLNATQAAIRAGYSQNTARVIGSENLTKPDIQAAIQEERDKLARKTEITQERVLREYARIAFFDPRKMFDENGNPLSIAELDDDTAAAIAGLDVVTEIDKDTGDTSYTKKYRIANKIGALDSVAKHLGMFDAGRGGPQNSGNNLLDAIKGTEVSTDEVPEAE